MSISLYCYPHPATSDRWVYVGQTRHLKERDLRHRTGKSNFGRRFKLRFPGVALPEPQTIGILQTQDDANFSETVVMFKRHTWHGYGGMNITLPGSTDYERLGKIAISRMPREAIVRGGITSGRNNVKTGLLASIASKGGSAAGRKASKIPGRMATLGHIGGSRGNREGKSKGGHKASLTNAKKEGYFISLGVPGRCRRWNINRGKPCTCGRHKMQPYFATMGLASTVALQLPGFAAQQAFRE